MDETDLLSKLPTEYAVLYLTIKTGLDSVLRHQVDHKNQIDLINGKIDVFRGMLSEEEKARMNADSELKAGCREDVNKIYRNVAIGGVTVIVGLVVWLIQKGT